MLFWRTCTRSTLRDWLRALAGLQARPPSLVLLDISLPAMDRTEVLKCLRASSRLSIPGRGDTMQDDLRAHYRQALPSRIAALEDARSAGAHSEILAIAHALRGSGGTHGFPGVTAAAAAVEAATADEMAERTDDLIDALRAVVEGTPEAPQEAGPSLRVLLVDDDPEIRLIVTHLLRGAGYDVAEASDARGAQAAISRVAPDVVLMDVMLGNEDGVTTAAALFRSMAAPPPRLVFLTGAVRAEQFERMNAAGAAGIIHKPFDPDSFLSLFARMAGVAR